MTADGRNAAHCSVVSIGGAGVLIEGGPGAGKTSLALGLIDTALARGLEAAMVADDRALLARRDGGVFARAPASIAGLAEIRGYGIARMASLPEVAVRLVARLVEDETIERMPEAATVELIGVDIPLLRLPARHEAQGVRIVLAFLAEGGISAAGDIA
jgi:serine kinase of HPr protein (carbohydrate metabolism regulator)